LESNFNGGHFYEKKLNVFKLGTQSVGRFHQRVPAKRPKKVGQKNYHFEFKIQIEQGSFLHKKLLQSKVTIVGIGLTAHGP
jgi:hypothetical protein